MSVKTPPPQPNAFEYPVDALMEFPRLDRTTKQPDGSEWPVGDPTRKWQYWCDDAPPADNTYNIWSSASMSFERVVVSNPSVPNIPGGTTKPYVPAPTKATYADGSPLNPIYLSNAAQAFPLVALMPGATLQQDAQVIHFNGEPRMLWQIKTPALDSTGAQEVVYVGVLVAQSAGPGHWDPAQLKRGFYSWIASPWTPPDLGLGTIDIPCRDLIQGVPNAETVHITDTLFGKKAMIRRNDIPDPSAPPTGGGDFSSADRALLATAANTGSGTYDVANQILALLKQKLGA